MTRHIVARTSDIPPGGNKVFGVEGRESSCSTSMASSLRCQSLSACRCAAEKAACVARLTLPEPRNLSALAGRRTAPLRLARLGIRHAQRAVIFRSEALQIRSYPVAIESGEEVAKESPKVLKTSRRVPTWPRPLRSMSRTATSSSRPEPPQHFFVIHPTRRKHPMPHAIRIHQQWGSRGPAMGGNQVGKPGPARRGSGIPRSASTTSILFPYRALPRRRPAGSARGGRRGRGGARGHRSEAGRPRRPMAAPRRLCRSAADPGRPAGENTRRDRRQDAAAMMLKGMTAQYLLRRPTG